MADITGKTKRAEETHYVSINDGGTQQANYNNDGAASPDSIAIGPDARALSNRSVSIGVGASAGRDTVAIGREASSYTDGVAIGTRATTTAGRGVAVGFNSNAVGNATAIGMQARALAQPSLAAGFNARVADTAIAGSSAIGSDSTALRTTIPAAYNPSTTPLPATALGDREVAFGGNTGLGIKNAQLTYVGAGSADTDAVNVAQLKAAVQAASANATVQTYFHVNTGDAAQPAGDPATNLGDAGDKGGATKADTIAAGVNAVAERPRSVAIGKDARTVRANSVALGNRAKTNDNDTVAVGSSPATGDTTEAFGRGSVAIGTRAKAGVDSTTRNTLAVGFDARATANQATAVGSGADATGASSVSVGNDDLHDVSRFNTTGAPATVNNGGDLANFFQQTTGEVMVDTANPYRPTLASGQGALAFGTTAEATGHLSTALGVRSQAQGIMSTAVGLGAKATLDNAVALGAGAVADRDSAEVDATSVPFNPATQALATNGTPLYRLRSNIAAVSVGKLDLTSGGAVRRIGSRLPQIVNVAPGTKDTDVATVAQLKGLSPLHYVSINYGIDSGTGNYNNDGATGYAAIAIGERAFATIDNSIALGRDSEAHRWDLATPVVASATPSAAEGDGQVYAPDNAPAAVKTAVTNTARNLRSPLSIGDGNRAVPMTRQINNVAAGTLDSDAVNVAQVKAVVAAAQAVGAVERKIRVSAVPTITVQADDYSLVARADNTTVTLPTAAGSLGRIIRIMNQNINYNVTLTQQYRDYQNASQTQLGSGQWVELQSDGTDWFAIGAG